MVAGMSNDPSKPPVDDPKSVKPRAVTKPADAKPVVLDERRLKFEEVAPIARGLDPSELIAMLHDGRGVVRANAALGLAAAGHAVAELVPLVRDSDAATATAVGEAIARLGPAIRPLIPQITRALDGAQPDVLDTIIGALAKLVGSADDELIAALDVPYDLAMKSIVAACARVGRGGVAFLIKAARHERGKIRINAVGGLARIGKVDIETSMAFLTQLEATDPVPDVRTAAKQASLAVIAREKVVAVDGLPKNIPTSRRASCPLRSSPSTRRRSTSTR